MNLIDITSLSTRAITSVSIRQLLTEKKSYTASTLPSFNKREMPQSVTCFQR